MVIITLGNGAELRVDNNRLIIVQATSTGQITSLVDLGRATPQRFEQLKSFITQLECHAVEEGAI